MKTRGQGKAKAKLTVDKVKTFPPKRPIFVPMDDNFKVIADGKAYYGKAGDYLIVCPNGEFKLLKREMNKP